MFENLLHPTRGSKTLGKEAAFIGLARPHLWNGRYHLNTGVAAIVCGPSKKITYDQRGEGLGREEGGGKPSSRRRRDATPSLWGREFSPNNIDWGKGQVSFHYFVKTRPGVREKVKGGEREGETFILALSFSDASRKGEKEVGL